MYHRVFEPAVDPWKLSVSPQNFAEQLAYLRQHHPVLSLQELSKHLQNHTLPRRAVVVTFDDGYCDNFQNAKPLLEKYDVPATVFVTTGHVNQAREFWSDELDRLLLFPTVSGSIRLTIDQMTYHWRLDQEPHPTNDPTSSQAQIYFELHRLLQPLSHPERCKVLKCLRPQLEGENEYRPPYRAMTSAEILQMAKGGLVQIGAHTVTHSMLSTQSTSDQKWEMVESRAWLEELVGYPVTLFAYPYGDMGSDTAQIAQEVGFVAACTTIQKSVTTKSKLFQLPRYSVENWDGDEFGRRLSAMFNQ